MTRGLRAGKAAARRWRRTALALLAALALAGGCARHGTDQGGDSAAHDEPAVVSVRVGVVTTRTFAGTIVAPGQWRSSGELVIAAPFAGVVETLLPRAGDAVRDGQRVGTLLTRESWSALRGAELMRDAARDPAAKDEAAHALELARRDLVRVPLVAPRAGEVIRRTVEPGSQVAESGEVLALVATDAIVFEAHVPAAEARAVRAGEPSEIREPDRAPRPARVQRVLPSADPADQSALVWLAPAAGAPPVLERFGTATITVAPPHQALALPDSAVIEDDLTGARRVAIADSAGNVRWTDVTLGPGADGWHELVHPSLAPGTRVVVLGQRGLPDGARVTWTR